MGDVKQRDIAGENIYKSGVDADILLELLREGMTDERQYRRLLLAAVEQLKSHMDIVKRQIMNEIKAAAYIIGAAWLFSTVVLAIVLVLM